MEQESESATRRVQLDYAPATEAKRRVQVMARVVALAFGLAAAAWLGVVILVISGIMACSKLELMLAAGFAVLLTCGAIVLARVGWPKAQ